MALFYQCKFDALICAQSEKLSIKGKGKDFQCRVLRPIVCTHDNVYLSISYTMLDCHSVKVTAFIVSISSCSSRDSTVIAFSVFLWALGEIRLSNLMPEI